jgi:ribosomal protein S12 methylthiotransferase
MSLQARISESILRQYLNRRLDVVLDEPGGKDTRTIIGRTRFQAPEVDGVVRIEVGPAAPRPLRAMEKVEIIGTGVYDLRGKLAL